MSKYFRNVGVAKDPHKLGASGGWIQGTMYLFDGIGHAFGQRGRVAHTGGTAVTYHLKAAEKQ